jgi:hypothetical protein
MIASATSAIEGDAKFLPVLWNIVYHDMDKQTRHGLRLSPSGSTVPFPV